MKKASFICFVSFSLACPFKTIAGNTYTTKNGPKPGIQSNQPVGINFINFQHAPASSVFKLLRLKLIADEYDNDDIAIAFDSAATTKYNDQLDARYLPGINAAEALYSLSSDSVPLSIDILPLPKQSALNIRLHVGAQKSGQLTLERTELDSIPAIYEVWLIDKYKKDSLDLRTNTSYIFNIDKTDSASFGNNRFTVVIRQDPALLVHLLDFGATKTSNGCNISWITENEQDNTNFTVERSIDGGQTYYALDSTVSSSRRSYSYTDGSAIDGTDSYRLKIIDLNGTVTYSNVISINSGSSIAPANNISVYPNPSNGVLNLAITRNNGTGNSSQPTGFQPSNFSQSFASTATSNSTSFNIKIVNMSGVVIKTATTISPTWQGNVSSLLPGTYVIQITSNADQSRVGYATFIKM